MFGRPPVTDHTTLVAFLTDSAKEAIVASRHDEAEELLALRDRLTARQFDRDQLKLPLELKQAA
jgi:hypothetical protein